MSDEHAAASHAHWVGAAADWVADAARREAGPPGRAADWMLEAADLKPGERVLELACGGADVGLRAAEAVGEGGRVLCTDFAEPMVDLVRERAAGLPQVEARVLDAQDPAALGGERFDAVLCRLGYMLIPQPDRALETSFAALEDGGRLALAVWAGAERNPWLSLLFDATMSTLGAPPPAPGTPGPFALADHDRMRALLEGAGFADVRVEDVEAVHEKASVDAWWIGMTEGDGPLSTIVKHLDATQVERIREAASGAAQRYVESDGAVRFPAALVVASARRR